MPFEFGDVVLVPFPFTSQTKSKNRPAVIVSNRTYNAAKPDVVVMPITSRLPSFFGVGEVLVDRFEETNHMPSSVIPGRHRQVASPESITLGLWLWIPGSRKSAPRNDPAYDSKFRNVELVGQWQTAGLLKPSTIKAVFATLEQPLIIRQLGTLDVADQTALRQAIGKVLG